VGRKKPRKHTAPPLKLTVGKAAVEDLELSGLERTIEGGLDVEEAHTAKMDEWIVWEGEEEARRGG